MTSSGDQFFDLLIAKHARYPEGRLQAPPLFANPARLDRIERLVAAGASAETVDDQLRGGFHYIPLDSPETVQRLVRLGIPVNHSLVAGDRCIQPALPVAASYASAQVVAELIRAGAKLQTGVRTNDRCDSYYAKTVLSYALLCDNVEVASLLWGREPLDFMRNSDKVTHLHDIAKNGRDTAHYVGLLVAAGVPVSSEDAHGMTPLFVAIQSRSDRVVEELLKHGARPGERLGRRAIYRGGVPGDDSPTALAVAQRLAMQPYAGKASGSCYFDNGRLDSDERRQARAAAPARIVKLLEEAMRR